MSGRKRRRSKGEGGWLRRALPTLSSVFKRFSSPLRLGAPLASARRAGAWLRRSWSGLAVPAAALALAALAWWWLSWTPLLKLVATPPFILLVFIVWVVGVLQGVDRVLPLVPMLLTGVTAAAVLACAVLAAGVMPELVPFGYVEWLAAAGGSSLLYLSGWLIGFRVSSRVRVVAASGMEGPSPPSIRLPRFSVRRERKEDVLPGDRGALI